MTDNAQFESSLHIESTVDGIRRTVECLKPVLDDLRSQQVRTMHRINAVL
jgi:hypothetical protein